MDANRERGLVGGIADRSALLGVGRRRNKGRVGLTASCLGALNHRVWNGVVSSLGELPLSRGALCANGQALRIHGLGSQPPITK